VSRYGFLTAWGHDWECQRSYAKSGNACVAVVVPANGHIGFTGNDWSCNPRFSQRADACTAEEG
jgi:hypothetical protein